MGPLGSGLKYIGSLEGHVLYCEGEEGDPLFLGGVHVFTSADQGKPSKCRTRGNDYQVRVSSFSLPHIYAPYPYKSATCYTSALFQTKLSTYYRNSKAITGEIRPSQLKLQYAQVLSKLQPLRKKNEGPPCNQFHKQPLYLKDQISDHTQQPNYLYTSNVRAPINT